MHQAGDICSACTSSENLVDGQVIILTDVPVDVEVISGWDVALSRRGCFL